MGKRRNNSHIRRKAGIWWAMHCHRDTPASSSAPQCVYYVHHSEEVGELISEGVSAGGRSQTPVILEEEVPEPEPREGLAVATDP